MTRMIASCLVAAFIFGAIQVVIFDDTVVLGAIGAVIFFVAFMIFGVPRVRRLVKMKMKVKMKDGDSSMS